MNRVLIIDDEEAVCWALREALVGQGYGVAVAGNAELGLKKAAEFQPGAVLLDIRLPGRDGLSIMNDLQKVSPGVAVIVMTAFGNLETAVKAVEQGAFEYLVKPFDLEVALDATDRALARAESLTKTIPTAFAPKPDDLVGASPAMQAVFKRIALAAGGDFPVLITGESGTGKERVARAIHRHSPFRAGPFLAVHLPALDARALEAEFFGGENSEGEVGGASRLGLVGLAEGGTLFLDEIADLPVGIQSRLLGLIERRNESPLETPGLRPVRCRLIAASSRDLDALSETGVLRPDLYYRLKVFDIALPPLRLRPGDIPLLARHFLGQFDPRSPPLSAAAIEALVARSWPGNVRELRNALEHAAILARGGPILPEHFPGVAALDQEPARFESWVQTWLATQEPEFLLDKFLAKVEPILLTEVMRQTGGNRAQAATRLGINRATLRRMMERYGIEGGAESGP